MERTSSGRRLNNMSTVYWTLLFSDLLIMLAYFILGFVAIRKERISVYDAFSCYVIVVMISKIVFTVISA